MKILITGGNGQLGSALKKILVNEKTRFTDVAEMDITDSAKISEVFEEFKPDWLVHGAALTNVDGCEEEPELAEKINSQATKNLAEACRKSGTKMIYISTDYVFDGKKREPYLETDQPNPQSVYGKTKLEGEKATLFVPKSYVLRTSWVYGEGKNFVRTMLSLADQKAELGIVNDQIGRPTWSEDLAKAIYDVIKTEPKPEIYNVSGDGEPVSWADFAREIFRVAGKQTKVINITSEEYLAQYSGRKIAPRPAYSVFDLNKSKKANIFIADHNKSLKQYLSTISELS